jgi:hypothetical protein
MLTSLLIVFSTFFSTPTVSDTARATEWKTLDRGDYTISHPADWAVDVSGNSGMDFIISSPFSDEEDMYNDFVNLTILPLPGLNKTLDSYALEVSRDIPFFYQKAIIRENKKDKKGNKDCYVMTYAGLMSEFPLAIRQYIWFENEKAYSLTFTAEQQAFEKWDETAIRIMDSFTFKN